MKYDKTLKDLIWRGTSALLAQRTGVPVMTISRRQLILGLRRAGLITDQEALDTAAMGAVPAAIRAVFDALPPDHKIEAEITWASMGVVERDNQLVGAVLAATGRSREDGDALFESWAAL